MSGEWFTSCSQVFLNVILNVSLTAGTFFFTFFNLFILKTIELHKYPHIKDTFSENVSKYLKQGCFSNKFVSRAIF